MEPKLRSLQHGFRTPGARPRRGARDPAGLRRCTAAFCRPRLSASSRDCTPFLASGGPRPQEREPTVAERHFANLTCFQAVGLSQGAPCMLRAALCRYLPVSLAKLAHSASISALTPARPAVKLGAGTANILPQARNTQPEKLRRLRSSSLQEERVSSKQLARFKQSGQSGCSVLVKLVVRSLCVSRRSHAAQCRILSFSAVRPALHELSQSRQTF